MLQINFNSPKPVYTQIAEAIEDDIISGKLCEGGAVYSQLVIAKELNVNPATAAKGINTLVAKGVLQKQRGMSMTVAEDVRERLVRERREVGFRNHVAALVAEAIKLGLDSEDIRKEIQDCYQSMKEARHE